jgi:predicted RNA-binding protein with RPS1 domain
MAEGERDEFGRVRQDRKGSTDRPSSAEDHYLRDAPHQERDHHHDTQNGGNDHHYGPAHEQEESVRPGTVIHGEVVRIETYGAFVEFQDEERSHQQRHRHKGLCHISQLANYRVEKVTDVLKMNQKVYAVVLDAEYDQRSGGQRIRLSLKDVDQTTGKYTGRDLSSSNRSARRGPRTSAHRLQIRAKLRREKLLSLHREWDSAEHGTSQQEDIALLRKLFSPSPDPPAAAQADPKEGRDKKKKTEAASESDSVSSSSSSSSDDSSSSSSVESDRRRRKRHRSSRSSKGRSSGRKQRGRESSKPRQRRRRDRSSSSSGSSSSSSSPSSSSSDSSNERHPSKKRKHDEEGGNDETRNIPDLPETDLRDAQELKQAVQGHAPNNEDEDEMEGPMPLAQPATGPGGVAGGSASYGKALLPGEGQALAQYVQQNLRIPRRGEIGYSGDDIDQFEKSGYVMSGSRHTRMNAVRIRKENQVYSAEEQRALALLTMEENQQKEAQLMEDFRVMLKEKQKMRQDAAK